jgi:hypothetical protein
MCVSLLVSFVIIQANYFEFARVVLVPFRAFVSSVEPIGGAFGNLK